LSLQEIIILIHRGEYKNAISLLESEVSSEGKSPLEKAECCKWLAECYQKLEDLKMSGNWYLEAIKHILSQQTDMKLKAKEALPLCEKALECYKQGGDTVDVMEAAKLKQRLLGLA
jgi:hypothetical protein